jgi:hypothetical protein
MPDLIAGPRLFGVTEFPDDEPWIWMEDIQAESSAGWPLPRFRTCAYHMGLLKGRFLNGAPLPADPRLDLSGHLRLNLNASEKRTAPFFDEFPKHPMTRDLALTDFGRRVWRLRAERHSLADAIERLPRSVVHGDFCYNNLFSRIQPDGRDQTVLIDWQYAGIRQIGSDVAPFVADCTMHPRFRKAAEPRKFLELTIEGFQAGLRDSGWQGDLKIPRFAVLARLAVITGGHRLAGLLDRVLRHDPTNDNRTQLETAVTQFVQTYGFILDVANEALSLLRVAP